ncbi:MAG: DUF2442 domain-containing protein [bacterium]|nr:DUF2442 domain-containing protein [bacterium]
MRIKIHEAIVTGRYCVRVKFNDGLEKEIDLTPFMKGEVFEPIKNDPNLFERMFIDGGTLCWPTGADVDPYVLYFGSLEEAERRLTISSMK